MGAFGRELEHWERYLGEGRFVAGAALSLGDLIVFGYLATAVRLGLELSGRPGLARFHDEMSARPAVRATWPWPEVAVAGS